jgi:hypothetical protein
MDPHPHLSPDGLAMQYSLHNVQQQQQQQLLQHDSVIQHADASSDHTAHGEQQMASSQQQHDVDGAEDTETDEGPHYQQYSAYDQRQGLDSAYPEHHQYAHAPQPHHQQLLHHSIQQEPLNGPNVQYTGSAAGRHMERSPTGSGSSSLPAPGCTARRGPGRRKNPHPFRAAMDAGERRTLQRNPVYLIHQQLSK